MGVIIILQQYVMHVHQPYQHETGVFCRDELFRLINSLPTCYEVVSGRAKGPLGLPPGPGIKRPSGNPGGGPRPGPGPQKMQKPVSWQRLPIHREYELALNDIACCRTRKERMVRTGKMAKVILALSAASFTGRTSSGLPATSAIHGTVVAAPR